MDTDTFEAVIIANLRWRFDPEIRIQQNVIRRDRWTQTHLKQLL